MYNATHVRDNELHDRKQVGQNPADSSCERRAALFTVWMKRPASVNAVCSHPHCLQPLNIILPSLPRREAGRDLKFCLCFSHEMWCGALQKLSRACVNEEGKNLFHCSLKSFGLPEFSSERRSTLVRNINSEKLINPGTGSFLLTSTGLFPVWNDRTAYISNGFDKPEPIHTQVYTQAQIYTYTPDIWLNAS